MLEKEKIKKLKKPLGEYFRLIIEAKKSGGIRRIFDAFNTIERIDHASRLLPSKFHIAASLYTAPTSLGTNLIGELI